MDKLYTRWAVECLQAMGYTLTSLSPEDVQITPWSDVVRFKTDSGYVFLKKTPELIYEPDVIQVLHNKFNAPVPEVIARNDDLNCFLMKDSGKHLRALLKNDFNVELACQAIDTFASLQVASRP